MRRFGSSYESGDGTGPIQKNRIPWTTKILIGFIFVLVILFMILIGMQRGWLEDPFPFLFKGNEGDLDNGTSSPAIQQGLSQPSPTFPPGSPWLTALSMVDIFTGPGEEYDRIGILVAGENAQIIGRSSDSKWWVIKVPYVETGRGWVPDLQVETQNSSGVTVLEEDVVQTQPPGTPSPSSSLVTAIANTNIRSGPGLEFIKIGLLAQGQTAEILGKDPEDLWWMINAPGVEGGRGWVSADYVVAQNSADVPVIGSSSIGQASIPTPGVGMPAMTASITLNIRSGPGTNYAIIGKMIQDQTAEVVGISADGLWWAIKIPDAQNGRGWVAAQYVTVINSEGVPVIR
jgi:uncharacterized protein YraI